MKGSNAVTDLVQATELAAANAKVAYGGVTSGADETDEDRAATASLREFVALIEEAVPRLPAPNRDRAMSAAWDDHRKPQPPRLLGLSTANASMVQLSWSMPATGSADDPTRLRLLPALTEPVHAADEHAELERVQQPWWRRLLR